jgi:hypothetical protein
VCLSSSYSSSPRSLYLADDRGAGGKGGVLSVESAVEQVSLACKAFVAVMTDPEFVVPARCIREPTGDTSRFGCFL